MAAVGVLVSFVVVCIMVSIDVASIVDKAAVVVEDLEFVAAVEDVATKN